MLTNSDFGVDNVRAIGVRAKRSDQKPTCHFAQLNLVQVDPLKLLRVEIREVVEVLDKLKATGFGGSATEAASAS